MSLLNYEILAIMMLQVLFCKYGFVKVLKVIDKDVFLVKTLTCNVVCLTNAIKFMQMQVSSHSLSKQFNIVAMLHICLFKKNPKRVLL